MAEVTAEIREKARSEAQEILARVLAGDPKPVRRVRKSEESKWHYVSPTGKRRGENLKNRPPVNDYDEIVRVFKEFGTIAAAARELGINRETVRRAVHQAGLSSPPGRRSSR